MKYKIHELCEINKNTLSKNDNYQFINYLDTSNLTEGTISDLQRLDVNVDRIPSRAKRIVKEHDILISTVRPNQKHYGIIHKPIENMIASTGFAVITPDKSKVYPEYLYRFLIQDQITQYLQAVAETSTSTYPSIKPSVIGKLEIELPTIKEQIAVANILASLDQKIGINNEINKKLEEMAQAIFKHWFVDFEFPNENGEPYKSSGGEMVESELGMIPKGWRVVKLKEIIEFIKNSTKPGEQLNNRKYVPIDTMPIKKLILNSYKSYKEAKSSLILFEKYDILIGAMRVYFHRVNLAPFRGVTRTTTFVLRSKSLEDISYNLLLLNMPSTISYADQSSIGSTIPYAVWEGGLGEMLLAQPPIEIRKKFNNVIFPLLEKMILNSQQNIRIQKIRDTLLPKLMSGEIRVPVEEEK
ncbi:MULTISPECIES: restriction endonuclease subunit S [Bacillaceae]|uniref:restriction endonuclease subunit S n=1 Tax=Bacillaceae TaxID=186817 RepID=UPI00204190E8|nr:MULTISPECIES: restriction endonuclease subunit S [Bacillaceae]MCM3479296.1 restriction endonuclease subunit S [Caldibacillus thermoamylovorans]